MLHRNQKEYQALQSLALATTWMIDPTFTMIILRLASVLGILISSLWSSHSMQEPRNETGSMQRPDEKPALLGVEMSPDDGPGVLVTRVVQESAAATVGLRAGDRILGIAGTATDSMDELRALLNEAIAGVAVELVFRRGDELRVVRTTLGARAPSKLERVIAVVGAAPGQTVADIGFGSAWLAIGLADMVGPEGRVYAVEIDPSAVEELRARGLPNIEVLLSRSDDVTLEEQSVDVAVLHDVASHVRRESRPGFYRSIARALRSNGTLVVFGPHGQATSMLEELASHGFHPDPGTALDALPSEQLDRRLATGIRFAYRNG